MLLDCPGNVVTLSEGVLACQDSEGDGLPWMVSPSFDVSQLSADQLAGPFGAGFVLVVMFWALGKGLSLVLSMVRR